MTKLYAKGGKEIVVPHAIDVQGWIDIGYTRENPAETKEDQAAGADMTAEEFDQVKGNLSSLNADKMKRVAKFAEVEYTNVKDTMAAVKEKFSL